MTRLQRMADFLRDLPKREDAPEYFDLTNWTEISPDEDSYHLNPKADCGYAACAIGSALILRVFEDEGFVFKDSHPYFSDENGEHVGWDAVKKFFDIDFDTALNLFDRDGYNRDLTITPKMVADRIEEVINNGQTST